MEIPCSQILCRNNWDVTQRFMLTQNEHIFQDKAQQPENKEKKQD